MMMFILGMLVGAIVGASAGILAGLCVASRETDDDDLFEGAQ